LLHTKKSKVELGNDGKRLRPFQFKKGRILTTTPGLGGGVVESREAAKKGNVNKLLSPPSALKKYCTQLRKAICNTVL